MEYLDLLQWPAMLITVIAAYLVGSQSKREAGFWVFLLSNALWVIWGAHDGAYAFIVLQVSLGALNIRGVFRNEKDVTAKA
jgi:hypothetical protein